jgi:hypothetical protein
MGGKNVKKSLLKSKSFVRFFLVPFLVITMIGCGFVASVPWIRNADNNQVVNLGDSIFALSGEINDFLHAYAGQTFRRYAVSGAELVGGILAPDLFSQYNTAKCDDPNINTIIMDGGGNDILLPVLTMFDPYDCKTQWYEWGRLSSSCKNFIDDLYVDGVNLMNDMYADGVDNVIYLGYYYTKNGLFALDDLEEAIDYGDMRLNQACQNSAVNCIFIDPRSTIKDSNILIDGIHPNTSGSEKLANLIWPKLAPLL